MFGIMHHAWLVGIMITLGSADKPYNLGSISYDISTSTMREIPELFQPRDLMHDWSYVERLYDDVRQFECETTRYIKYGKECYSVVVAPDKNNGHDCLCVFRWQRDLKKFMKHLESVPSSLWEEQIRLAGKNVKKAEITDVIWLGASKAGTHMMKYGGTRDHRVSLSKNQYYCNRIPLVPGTLKYNTEGRNLMRYQMHDIKTLLEMRVRYFDFDVCIDQKAVLRTCHCMSGIPLDEAVEQILNFLVVHPREFVIIYCHHGVRGYIGEDHAYDVSDMVYEIMGDMVVPKSQAGQWPFNIDALVSAGHQVMVIIDTDEGVLVRSDDHSHFGSDVSVTIPSPAFFNASQHVKYTEMLRKHFQPGKLNAMHACQGSFGTSVAAGSMTTAQMDEFWSKTCAESLRMHSFESSTLPNVVLQRHVTVDTYDEVQRLLMGNQEGYMDN